MNNMIVLGKKMMNVNEIMLVEISIVFPKYEKVYGCILITFKNGVTTEILNENTTVNVGWPKSYDEIKEAKQELQEMMERELEIVTRIINNKLNKESEVVNAKQ